jgi:hypothetical protein
MKVNGDGAVDQRGITVKKWYVKGTIVWQRKKNFKGESKFTLLLEYIFILEIISWKLHRMHVVCSTSFSFCCDYKCLKIENKKSGNYVNIFWWLIVMICFCNRSIYFSNQIARALLTVLLKQYRTPVRAACDRSMALWWHDKIWVVINRETMQWVFWFRHLREEESL